MNLKILVTGAGGQIGTELVEALRPRYGECNVVAGGYQKVLPDTLLKTGPVEYFDVCDSKELHNVLQRYEINVIYHLAGMLSAVAEENPQLAWDVNVGGLRNILDAAKEIGCSVFFPSSIGAFGPATPSLNTPQVTIQRPNTIYGITKVSGELLCDYYHKKFGVDTRGLRLPGLISHQTKPGGGTTDYAVEIFFSAIQQGKYTCFLKKDTYLDMMYMPDAIKACMKLMETRSDKLIHRNAFNITAMSFSPEQLASTIREIIPTFKMDYKVDPVRQAIADSWPDKLDDSAAREEWGWLPQYDLESMTREMITSIQTR